MIGWKCHGCGATAPDGHPFTCPASGNGDVDHLLSRQVGAQSTRLFDDPNPFVRFASRFSWFDLGVRRGLLPEDLLARARAYDAQIRSVEGHGFRETPTFESRALAEALGGSFTLLVKNETGNVSGSHKARHTMGIALYLEIAEALGLRPKGQDLAISSCGNAALGAAVIAKAGQRPLRVFVPKWADEVVVRRLLDLGARVEPCERQTGEMGDPCTLRMRDAVKAGAVPFSCQGTDAGLAIEGGMTLGLELASWLHTSRRPLDRIFVQVGGGALLSSTVQALEEARNLELIPKLPKIHAVQAAGAAPLARAYGRVLEALSHIDPGAADAASHGDPISAELSSRVLTEAKAARSQFMWPWDDPHSLAHGILDDETYDWVEIVRGMLITGGHPVTVSEDLVKAAFELGPKATGVDVCPTGTAGLAGLMASVRNHEIQPEETVAVLFTGKRRS